MTPTQQVNRKVQDNLKTKAILETSEDWYKIGVAHNMAFINWLNGKEYGKETND